MVLPLIGLCARPQEFLLLLLLNLLLLLLLSRHPCHPGDLLPSPWLLLLLLLSSGIRNPLILTLTFLLWRCTFILHAIAPNSSAIISGPLLPPKLTNSSTFSLEKSSTPWRRWTQAFLSHKSLCSLSQVLSWTWIKCSVFFLREKHLPSNVEQWSASMQRRMGSSCSSERQKLVMHKMLNV